MDMLEKLNKAFTGWYESWFGDEVGNIRPKDVLRRILNAMEDNRKEGLDNRIYVPNKYILEISFASQEEREYLLAFLEKEELESAMRKYMAQSKYYVRGPLDLTIEETPSEGDGTRLEKISVKCRWDVKPAEDEIPSKKEMDEEEYTVAAIDMYGDSTVAPPSLNIKHVDGSTEVFRLDKPNITIGRSRRLNNDLVIDKDGMVSKRHAGMEMTQNGFVINDLNSTNGVWVNGARVNNALLKAGDVVKVGRTEMTYEDAAWASAKAKAAQEAVGIRAKLEIFHEDGTIEDFMLGTEATIGRYLSSDLRIDHPSIASAQATVLRKDDDYFVVDNAGDGCTYLNGMCLNYKQPAKLKDGDKIKLGAVSLRFRII